MLRPSVSILHPPAAEADVAHYDIMIACCSRPLLTFKIPNLEHSITVEFPNSRLAVCGSCKETFKLRDECRSKLNHTEEPWTPAHVCITLEDDCFEDGKIATDRKLVVKAVEEPQPFLTKQPLETRNAQACFCCKARKRTVLYCRKDLKHRYLPWNTVFCRLGAEKAVHDESEATKTNEAEATKTNEAEKEALQDEEKEDKVIETIDVEKDDEEEKQPSNDEEKQDNDIEKNDIEEEEDGYSQKEDVSEDVVHEAKDEKDKESDGEDVPKEDDCNGQKQAPDESDCNDGNSTNAESTNEEPQTQEQHASDIEGRQEKQDSPEAKDDNVDDEGKKMPSKKRSNFDIRDIPDGCRTFVAVISCDERYFEWLERGQFPSVYLEDLRERQNATAAPNQPQMASQAPVFPQMGMYGFPPAMIPIIPGMLPFMTPGNMLPQANPFFMQMQQQQLAAMAMQANQYQQMMASGQQNQPAARPVFDLPDPYTQDEAEDENDEERPKNQPSRRQKRQSEAANAAIALARQQAQAQMQAEMAQKQMQLQQQMLLQNQRHIMLRYHHQMQQQLLQHQPHLQLQQTQSPDNTAPVTSKKTGKKSQKKPYLHPKPTDDKNDQNKKKPAEVSEEAPVEKESDTKEERSTKRKIEEPVGSDMIKALCEKYMEEKRKRKSSGATNNAGKDAKKGKKSADSKEAPAPEDNSDRKKDESFDQINDAMENPAEIEEAVIESDDIGLVV